MDEPSEPISSGSSQFPYSSVPMAGLPLAGAMFGLCLGGPVGLLAGVKLGGFAAVGGSILGYTGASVIKEQREIRNHIDDHYKNDPDLFVRTPRQEAAINRRRLSEQTAPGAPRHLLSLRRTGSIPGRGPAGYRRQSRADLLVSRSLTNSPVSRRRASCYRKHSNASNTSIQSRKSSLVVSTQPPHLKPQKFRRLGDLSEDEQQSVLALICKDHPNVPSLLVNIHVCQAQEVEKLQMSKAEGKKKNKGGKEHIRASSLPDVLEEDSISNKS